MSDGRVSIERCEALFSLLLQSASPTVQFPAETSSLLAQIKGKYCQEGTENALKLPGKWQIC